jgi:hypothetical protein
MMVNLRVFSGGSHIVVMQEVEVSNRGHDDFGDGIGKSDDASTTAGGQKRNSVDLV